MTQHHSRMVQDQVKQHPLLIRSGQAEQALCQRRLVRSHRGGRGHQGGRGVPPAPLTLKGVRRQRNSAAVPALEHTTPVHAGATNVEFTQRRQETPYLILIATQRPNRQAVAGGVASGVEDVLQRRSQHRMRAHLNEASEAPGDHGTHGGVEPHLLTQVAVPVLRVESTGIHLVPHHSGEQWNLAGAGRRRGEGPKQAHPEIGDLRGVRGVVHPDPAGPHPLAGDIRKELRNGEGVAGDHHQSRAVHRRDAQPPVPASQPLACLLLGQPDREHASTTGHGSQQPAADRHRPGRVIQRQRASYAGCGDLALGMANHRTGLHPAVAPVGSQRHHHAEQRGLDNVDPVHGRGAPRAFQDIQQRPIRVWTQGLGAVQQLTSKRRCGVKQLHGHPGPLRALAREDERHTGAG